jgi:hypothetical protein
MKNAHQEIAALEQTLLDAANEQVKQLDDLQLALVGGGSGDPILY